MTEQATRKIPFSADTLAVLGCVFRLTADTGMGADRADVEDMLRSRYGIKDTAKAIETAEKEGAVEFPDW